MKNLVVEILEEFAAAQGMCGRHAHPSSGGLEALRRAYRERQRERGLCVSAQARRVRLSLTAAAAVVVAVEGAAAGKP